MLVEKETYLLELSRYIHLNPFRAGFTRNPEEYQRSSLPAYVRGKADFPFSLHEVKGKNILSIVDSAEKPPIHENLEHHK